MTALVDDIAAAARRPPDAAISLPPDAYRRADLFRLEVDRVLRPGWIGICRIDQVAEPGSVLPVDLLGEALVVSRDRSGVLRVLSRVCRHRSMEIKVAAGRAAALQCPYHQWTYALSGELVGAPQMDRAQLTQSGCALPAFATEEWGGFLFVNLDGQAAPLTPTMGGLEQQLATAGLDLGAQLLVDSTDYGEQAWDWKVMVDNFMECYHHLGSHRSSLEAAYPAASAWTDQGSDAHSCMHIVPAAEHASPDSGWPTGDPMRGEPSCLVQIYPLTLCSVRRSGTNVVRVLPLGPGRIHLLIDMLAPPEVVDRPDFPEILAARREATGRVNAEDLAACAAVQRGLSAPSAAAGRLSSLEQPLWEFIRHLDAQLSSGG